MILPQEIEVFYVIPAIRKELAKRLMINGFKQKEIAKIFGVTEACISNYVKSRRASKVVFNSKVKKVINNKSSELINGGCAIKVINDICKEFKASGCLCNLHHELEPVKCNNKGCML